MQETVQPNTRSTLGPASSSLEESLRMPTLLPQGTAGSFLGLLLPGGHTLSRPAGTKDKLSPGLHPLSSGSPPPSGSHLF